MGEVQDIAKKLGVEGVRLEIGRLEDVMPVFNGLRNRADAVYIVDSAVAPRAPIPSSREAARCRLLALF